ncbi:MAG TPA: VOC family protein [Acidimicrobiia bacterium]|jgi:hypothetical protein|nr:VOC family protein [Acidimicrobiia bacterium]
MPTVQVVFDCENPHTLAAFWAEAVGLEVEDHHDRIVQLIEEGVAPESETITLDGRKAWRGAAACRDPEGRLPRLLFQVVPEPKTVKNRVHLDIHVGEDHIDSKVAELEALGASRLWDGSQGPYRWVTMADAEGNEFCVS